MVKYGILMPAFYLPLIIMLLSLGLRGVSFDFRFQAVGKSRRFWDVAFSLGSIAAASMQGLILGGLLQGVTITGREFSGSVFDSLHPFPIVTAVAVLAGYVVLGGGWLHLKATGAVRSLEGSYLLAFVASGLACLLASLLVLRITRPVAALAAAE